MKPTKCPAREKKMRQEKRKKKREERKRKVKVKTAVSLLNQTIILQFCFLHVHARTSQANILHLDQKAAKCTTCKQLYGKF